MTFDPRFLTISIAHRARHDGNVNVCENSMTAIDLAIEQGWGIEIDLQPAADWTPMMFHDYDLHRLTGETGTIRQYGVRDLEQMHLGQTADTIPTFETVLERVAGRAPLLVEIKDQDGTLGPDVGPFEQAICKTLRGYNGPVALMSFNPYAVASCAEYAPDIPRGLTTDDFTAEGWESVPPNRREALNTISDLNRVDGSFISHDRRDLTMPIVKALKESGTHILCWTVRSKEQEAEARHIVENITFEGYTPA